ncbi:MAG: 50S ribosomal protein L9 [Candidatus Aminicenantes bacterium]|nr:50S ribosomal protein L9 [Candidatus Aminicenantes bacterium]
MRVILKKDVENLGSQGDIVDVAPGFGRNYLIPKQLALEVTSSNMKMIEIERQALKKKLEKERQSFEGLIQNLNQVTLSFERKSGEKDMIFGSVSSADIKDALHELGFEIDKKKILLDEPIKRLGNYSVPIKIFQEDKAEIKVEVLAPGGEIGEEKKDEEVPEEKIAVAAEEREELEEEKKEEVPEEKKEQEEIPEEQLKEDEAEIKEPEVDKKEKKEAGEIPEGKREKIEGESIKADVEMLEKQEREVMEEKKEEEEMPSDKEEKAAAGAEKKEKEGKKDKKKKKEEKKRSKK